MSRGPRLLASLLASALALVLAGCGTSVTGSAEERLVVGSVLTPSSLDPVHVTGGHDPMYLQLVYDRLLETDHETGEVVPGLATDWGYSKDKSRFFLTLREGVEFSDGNPVDAEAVKLNLDRAFEKTKLGHITSVKKVEVTGEYTLTLTMAHESAWLAEQLAYNSGYIVSPAAIEDTEDVTTDPIGSGPYVITEYLPGFRIVFEKNPDYWNPDRGHYPIIEMDFFKNQVTLNQALQAGRVEVASRILLTDVASLQKDDSIEVGVEPSLAHFHIQFNTTRPALADPRVRRAINFALDRDALAKAATQGVGEATESLFPPTYKYSNEALQSMYGYQPDKAKELLAEAGKKNLELECVTYTGSGFETAAPYIIEQLARVGVDINLDIMELPEAMAAFYNGDDLSAAKNGPDCNFTSWPGQPTPRDAIQAEYGKSVYNNGHHEYVDFDLLTQLETTYDPQARIDLVRRIELEASEDPMMANLYTKPQAYAYRPEVTGFVEDLMEFDLDFADLRPAE